MRLEEAAFHERHADDLEVVFVDALMLCQRRIFRSRLRTPVDRKGQPPAGIERQEVGQPCLSDAGLRAQRRQQLIVEVGDLPEVAVARRQVDVDRQHARRLEAGILLHQPLKTAAEQRCPDQQHYREAN